MRSAWEESPSGPDRRIYQLTRQGGEALHEQTKALAATSEILQAFLSRYSEFVALDREPGATRRGVDAPRR